VSEGGVICGQRDEKLIDPTIKKDYPAGSSLYEEERRKQNFQKRTHGKYYKVEKLS